MRQIFFLITVVLLLNQNAIADIKIANSNLEEVPINNKESSNTKIQSLEEIRADLNARKAAAEPFSDKDVKIDVESLGLDSVDDKKPDDRKSAAPTQSLQPQIPSLPKAENSAQKSSVATTESPKKTKDIPGSIAAIVPIAVAEKSEEGKSASINIKGNQESGGNKIFSKIQSFISGKNNTQEPATATNQPQVESKIDEIANSATKSLKALKKEKLRQRIAKEKKEAEERRAKERKEAKIKRLNKLRAEYLIKLSNGEANEEFSDEDLSAKTQEYLRIVPKEKSFRWSDRFISYDPPPLPIIDRYRGNDNKHIPTIPTIQEKVDLMFQAINSNNPAYFNSAYQQVLDPNVHNQNGETILTYATLFQKYGTMSSILAKGADPDLPNALGHTPLDIAIELLDIKSAQILIEMNADPNYVNGLGRTYLMSAARLGFLPMADLLISQGVDINALDNEGLTALATAQKYKQDIMVKFLLKSGAQSLAKKPRIVEQNIIKELENRWGIQNTEVQK